MDLGGICQPCLGLLFIAQPTRSHPSDGQSAACTSALQEALLQPRAVLFVCPQPERGAGKNVLVETGDLHCRVVLVSCGRKYEHDV